MYNQIYEAMKRSCGYVTIVLDGETISQGTCFAFTPDGEGDCQKFCVRA